MTSVSDESARRLAELAQQLNRATERASDLRQALRQAERASERADDAVARAREALDLHRLLTWGDAPNIAELLAPDCSTCFYRAGQALAEAHGLGFGMKWADSGQTVLHVRLNRDDQAGVQRAAAAIRFFAPHVKRKARMARFSVQHCTGEFALELHYSMRTNKAQLLRLEYNSTEGTTSFETLESALTYVSKHHWVEDIIDLKEGQVLLPAA